MTGAYSLVGPERARCAADCRDIYCPCVADQRICCISGRNLDKTLLHHPDTVSETGLGNAMADCGDVDRRVFVAGASVDQARGRNAGVGDRLLVEGPGHYRACPA